MAQVSGIPEDVSLFYKELDEFEIQLPGNKMEPFYSDETLLEITGKQYPKWKNQGKVTSVPVARVPKLFIDSEQMHKKLQREVKGTLKGEEAEQHLYRLFTEHSGAFKDEPGVIIFPNFDGSHIFKSKAASVEIDMALIHPTKGVFVFNVKNEGSSKQVDRAKQLAGVKKDIKKHTNFIRLLINYKSKADLPIHSVICDFASENSKLTELKNEDSSEKVIVFSKEELKKSNFVKLWSSKLAEIGCKTNTDEVNLLVARMIALASIEGADVLIGEKMKRGLLQSVSKMERLQTQMERYDDEELKQKIPKLSENKPLQKHTGERSKKVFILWSADQLEVIGRIYEQIYMENGTTKGARILINGGKGTGKTMLLVFLAKMATIMLESEHEVAEELQQPKKEKNNKKMSTLVSHGNLRCRSLTTALEEALKGIDVTVEDLKPAELQHQLQSFKMILCDEATNRVIRLLLENLREDQHLVLFTAEKERNVDQQFEQFFLKTCLRSTSQLARFANTYHSRQLESFSVHIAFPSKTFHGELPEIRWADENSNENDFMRKSIDAILEFAADPIWLRNSNQDFQSRFDFAVVPLIPKDLLQRILDKLPADHSCSVDQALGTLCTKSGVKVEGISQQNRNETKINFYHPLTIEGFEFSKVLILLDNKNDFFQFDDSHFFTACTRACLKLLIVTNECKEQDEDWWQNCFGDFVRSEVGKILGGDEEEKTKISFGAEHPSVLFVGRIKDLLESLKCCNTDQEHKYTGFQSTVYEYEKDNRKVLQTDDIYLEQDLKKMKEMGVKKIVFVTDNICANKWQHYFMTLSYWFCYDFNSRNTNYFHIKDLLQNDSETNFQMSFRKALLCPISGQVDVEFPRFWLKLEKNSLSSVLISWEEWIAKAEKCHEQDYITQAIFIYECGIETLRQQITSNESESLLKKKLADLSLLVANTYIDSFNTIVEESKCSYWVPTTQYEVCLLKAFRHAVNALKWHASDLNLKFNSVERLFQEMKKYPTSELFEREIKQMNKDDTSGMIFETRLRHESPQIPMQLFPDFEEGLRRLELLICNYEKRSFGSTDMKTTRESISVLARNLVVEKVCPLSEVEPGDDAFQESLSKMMVQLDYPVQLAMIALHWDHKMEGNLKLFSHELYNLEKSFELVKSKQPVSRTGSNETLTP